MDIVGDGLQPTPSVTERSPSLVLREVASAFRCGVVVIGYDAGRSLAALRVFVDALQDVAEGDFSGRHDVPVASGDLALYVYALNVYGCPACGDSPQSLMVNAETETQRHRAPVPATRHHLLSMEFRVDGQARSSVAVLQEYFVQIITERLNLFLGPDQRAQEVEVLVSL